VQLVLLFV